MALKLHIILTRTMTTFSHLLFAYDTIVFTGATQDEVGKILECFHTYEQASGQWVNFEKTKLSFCRNVLDSSKAMI